MKMAISDRFEPAINMCQGDSFSHEYKYKGSARIIEGPIVIERKDGTSYELVITRIENNVIYWSVEGEVKS